MKKPLFSITVDVEDWYHVPAVCGSSFSKYKDTSEFFDSWKGRYDYLTRPTYRIIDLLSEFGIRGTFFIVAEVVERYGNLVKEIQNAGHEIACHGLNHRCYIDSRTTLPITTKEYFRKQIIQAKKTLENATNAPVVGFRAPAGYISGWMLDIIENVGFEYDSSVSVNSLYNKTDSDLSGVGRTPYYPDKGKVTPGVPRQLIEIPWPYYKLGSFMIPTAGGPFLRFLGARIILRGLNQSLRVGSAQLYIHPLDVSREQFPSGFSIKGPFYWTIKGKVVENRIRWILSKLDVKYTTLNELSHKWRRVLASPS